MAVDPKFARPKRYPAPEFPPRRIARFTRMPPAVFPVVLGLLGMGLAARRLLVGTALEGLVEAVLGAILGGLADATGVSNLGRPAGTDVSADDRADSRFGRHSHR